MARHKNTWVYVLVGGLVFFIVIGVLVIGFGVYLASQHVAVETTTRDSAEREFEQVRARFPNQRPYIEVPRGGRAEEAVINRDMEKVGGAPLETLHVLAWDPHERKLLRLHIPFWLVRLGGKGTMRGFATGVDVGPDVSITAKDLERHGRGLILDHQGPRGERVLVWVQ